MFNCTKHCLLVLQNSLSCNRHSTEMLKHCLKPLKKNFVERVNFPAVMFSKVVYVWNGTWNTYRFRKKIKAVTRIHHSKIIRVKCSLVQIFKTKSVRQPGRCIRHWVRFSRAHSFKHFNQRRFYYSFTCGIIDQRFVCLTFLSSLTFIYGRFRV